MYSMVLAHLDLIDVALWQRLGDLQGKLGLDMALSVGRLAWTE